MFLATRRPEWVCLCAAEKSKAKMIIPVKVDRGCGDAEKEAAVAGVSGSSDAGREHNNIQKGDSDGMSVPQWSMVELQGELISKEPLSGQSLGKMTFENVSACVVDL